MESNKNNAWLTRKGEPYRLTKEHLRSLINPLDPATFIKVLEEMDYPFIEHEWIRAIETIANKGLALSWVIGKYIAIMNLAAYRSMTFADSNFIPNQKYKIEVRVKEVKNGFKTE